MVFDNIQKNFLSSQIYLLNYKSHITYLTVVSSIPKNTIASIHIDTINTSSSILTLAWCTFIYVYKNNFDSQIKLNYSCNKMWRENEYHIMLNIAWNTRLLTHDQRRPYLFHNHFLHILECNYKYTHLYHQCMLHRLDKGLKHIHLFLQKNIFLYSSYL